MKEMTKKRQQYYDLRCVEGKSYKEISDLFGVTINAVKSEICRARQMILANGMIPMKATPPRILYYYKAPKKRGRKSATITAQSIYENYKKTDYPGRIKTMEIIQIEKMLGL